MKNTKFKEIVVGIIVVLTMVVACENSVSNDAGNVPDTGQEKKTFTVTFDSNGGSDISPINDVDYGDTISKPEDPVKAGYDCFFTGWYNKGLTEAFSFNTAITSDITLYAKWRPYELGQTGPGQGKIFYRDEAGFPQYQYDNKEIICHYLEAAPADMDTTLIWWDYQKSADTGVINGIYLFDATGIGMGRRNTALILINSPNAAAAKACNDYKYGGNTDWFLPSKDELNMLYVNRAYIGNLTNNSYWSSSGTVDDSGFGMEVWRLKDGTFSTGFMFDIGHSVRAVRSF